MHHSFVRAVGARVTWRLLAAFAVALPVWAAGSAPSLSASQGYDTSDCVAIDRSRSNSGWDQIDFRNVCNAQIFVIYCGELQFNQNVCDGSRRSSYYSHSINLRAGQRHTVDVQSGGWLRWGACGGSIGFENDGHFTDDDRGYYSCLAR